ncbi:methylmalonyl-CoA epimerase [Deferrisoma camini]|uniref:methylmalonyl-CoA epimerase n=1 Tax=Deferrisoma camini TaxID=1035120 RepID=UPI00046D20C2|nr:methylmalonyl-CoA epimerase [Deferrisoma camini]
MPSKINHIGIAVPDIEAAAEFYTKHLGLELGGVEEVADQKVKVAFLPVGEVRIELVQPTSPESPVAKFLERNGPGFHHIAYQVDDVAAEVERLKAEGVRMVDQTPRSGAHNTRIAFVHPKASGGVLTELVQEMGE